MSKRSDASIPMPKLERKPRQEAVRSRAWTLSRLEDTWHGLNSLGCLTPEMDRIIRQQFNALLKGGAAHG
jgi:hypothetical protein